MAFTESYWPATEDGELFDWTVGDALREMASRHPDRTALIEAVVDASARRRWTYAELLAAAEQTAHALLSEFEPGDHIAVWSANCPEWVILQFGIGLAGMVLVTVNPAYKASELEYVLKQSKARGVFHQTVYRGAAMADVVAEVLPGIEGCDQAFSIDAFDDFIARAGSGERLPVVKSSDPVMIQYTSGTTGFPKGAMLHHHGIVNNSRLSAELRGAGDGTVDITCMPLFHTGGCVVGVLGTLQTGGTLVLLPEFEPEHYLDMIEQERGEFTLPVPTMLIALLEAQAERARDLSSLKVVMSGGSTVPVELVRKFENDLGVRFSIIFGQTETSPIITMGRLDDDPKDKSETLGRPIPQTEVRIINPDTGEVVPVGEKGELCTRGFLVMNEYFDMPEPTARTIDAEGWLHTGDLCSMDARGFFYIEGRLKDMIIRGGENIYPREIEELLFSHPAIAAVAVVGIPDERWGEQVGAFVRFESGESMNKDELAEYLQANLARHKVPKIWARVDEFPLTASGKIKKHELAAMRDDGRFGEI